MRDKDGYEDVAGDHEVPEGAVRFFELDRGEIMLCRFGGELKALSGRCTHAFASLQDGEISGGKITCAVHGAQFALPSGKNVSGNCADLPSYPIRMDGNRIMVKFS